VLPLLSRKVGLSVVIYHIAVEAKHDEAMVVLESFHASLKAVSWTISCSTRQLSDPTWVDFSHPESDQQKASVVFTFD
jgi:hypothetical protein